MNNTFRFVLYITTLFAVNFSFAQRQKHNTIKIDSATAAQARATLNKLPVDKFLKRSYNEGNRELPYRFLLPESDKQGTKYPLVIVLHNSTRIGNDNEKQLEPLSRIWIRDEIYKKYKCFVLAPQFSGRSSNYIVAKNGLLVSKPSDEVYSLLKLITDLQKEYTSIDAGRIYLVGYSMGGSTAQNMLSISPERFAGMVSVAAVPDFSNLEALNAGNIWLIHGAKDTENLYEGSVTLFAKLRKNKKVIFTTYDELDHNNIAIPLLLDEAIPKWLFKQQR
jgi:predicted peptidase